MQGESLGTRLATGSIRNNKVHCKLVKNENALVNKRGINVYSRNVMIICMRINKPHLPKIVSCPDNFSPSVPYFSVGKFGMGMRLRWYVKSHALLGIHIIGGQRSERIAPPPPPHPNTTTSHLFI